MIIRVLDFETTGFWPDGKVCQWATFDLVEAAESWQRGDQRCGMVNPGIPIPPEASAIHHIIDEDVTDAPGVTDALKLITAPPVPDIWAAHNNRFEQHWFNPAGSRWIDTYRCALAIWPEAPLHSNQCLRYWLRLRLRDAPTPHRADGDAYVTAAILRRMLSYTNIDYLLAVSTEPAMLPRFIFGKHAMKPIGELPVDYLEWVISDKGITDNEDVRHTAYSELRRRRANT